jgi:hypothetical protein
VARNVNLQPFDVAGVAAAPIVHANTDKLDDYQIDNDDGIIAVGDIPQQPPHAPLVVVNNTDDDNDTAGSGDNEDNDDNNVDKDEDDDDLSDEDDDDEPAAATKGNESDSNQGVRRLRRRGKGTSKKYANYSLLMAARQSRRGGQSSEIDSKVIFMGHEIVKLL